MNIKSILSGTLLLALSGAEICQAGSYTFTPPDHDLNDLDHYYADLWGMNFTLAADEKIIGASISFDNIRNWTTEPNDLYITLLDYAPLGLTRQWDNQATGNYWGSQGLELAHYHNLSATATDITYAFTSSELTTLGNYLSGSSSPGRFGLGFDADCHFYNDGVTFTITTANANDPVPEPTTMALFGIGIAGIGYYQRKKNKFPR